MEEAPRDYDLVLWGATGFTGQLVAEYLTERYDNTDLALALAGRNEEKLQSLRDRLLDPTDGWDSLPILIGDAFDRPSLDEIAERTTAVCSTVGPYAVYGTDLVEACIDRGTHYCDLTGEIQWIRRMIDNNHDAARSNRARIVHACGFDSVPSDIGTLMVQDYARQKHDTACDRIKAYVTSSSFSLSGGTFASMIKTFEAASEDPRIRKLLETPYSLNPPGEREGPDEPIQRGPAYDPEINKWTAPFMMAITNEKVVRRTNALLDYPWGRDFRYGESMPTGPGIRGSVTATAIAAGFMMADLSMSIGPIRNTLNRFFLPESGDGPDRDTIENSSFEVRLIGKGTRTGSEEAFTVEGKITADRDPGYGATAWMLGESAVCLALGETDTSLDGGVLTPASGIGPPLIDRLRATTMTLEVQ